MRNLFIKFVIALFAMLPAPKAWSFSLILNANQVLENNGGYWIDPEFCYSDDVQYAVAPGTANGFRYLRVGLEDPLLDTTNLRITAVILYAKGFTDYSKSKARLQPYFNGTAGTESGGLNFGTSEMLQSFNITGQRAVWTWQELRNLSVRFTPRTAANFSLNNIFAMVTYTDSTVMGDYSFEISAVSSPETLGYYFPLRIVARDSAGDTARSYNGTVSLSDSTGTITPASAAFVSGVCQVPVMIGAITAGTAITVDDGDTFSVSKRFEVISGLHHFWLAPIASPQTAGVPFAVNVSACDFNGDTLASYSGKAGLDDLTGTLSQDSTGNFISGIWNGNITVNGGSGTFDTVWAHFTKPAHTSRGSSNAFLVQAPLGVEMNWMTVTPLSGELRLEWQTQSERDCAYWAVERASSHQSYLEIGRISGGGNSNTARLYTFSDGNLPGEGTYTYRLVETSTSGAAAHFGPITAYWQGLPRDTKTDLKASPNPVTAGRTVISFNSTGEQRAMIRIYNITGALVRTIWDRNISTGRQQAVWDGRDREGLKVASGVYVIKLSGEINKAVCKVSMIE